MRGRATLGSKLRQMIRGLESGFKALTEGRASSPLRDRQDIRALKPISYFGGKSLFHLAPSHKAKTNGSRFSHQPLGRLGRNPFGLRGSRRPE